MHCNVIYLYFPLSPHNTARIRIHNETKQKCALLTQIGAGQLKERPIEHFKRC